MIAWGVWARRNKKIFEHIDTHPKETLLTALATWEDYRSIRE